MFSNWLATNGHGLKGVSSATAMYTCQSGIIQLALKATKKCSDLSFETLKLKFLLKVLAPEIQKVEKLPQSGQFDVRGWREHQLLELLLVMIGSPPTLDSNDLRCLLSEDFNAPDLWVNKDLNLAKPGQIPYRGLQSHCSTALSALTFGLFAWHGIFRIKLLGQTDL